MTASLIRTPLGFSLPALAGAAAAAAVAGYPQTPYPAVALLCATLVGTLTLWPWAALPVALLGGALTSELLGLSRVTSVVAVHVALLALGFLTLALRRGLDPLWGRRVATAADLPMALVVAGTALSAAFGLARGNPPYEAMVAAYQIAVIPAYFFLTTLTLNSRRRLRLAAVTYAAGAAALALVGFAVPGRHGGLLSALALLPMLALATRTAGARRRLVLAASALLAIDVVFAAYRSVWLVAGIALVFLVLRGGTGIRRFAAAALVLAALASAVALSASSGFGARSDTVAAQLAQPSGYRLPEARIGLDAFLENPLVGKGLGQVTPEVAVPEFGVVDVGPVYHAFYVTVLANAGLAGLTLVLWPLLTALRRSRRPREPAALAVRGLLVGFAVAAAFAGPADGHWELGLLPALALIIAAWSSPRGERT